MNESTMRGHRLVRVLLTHIDSLLFDLADHKDPDRDKLLHANDDLCAKLRAYGNALNQPHATAPSMSHAERTIATNQFRLLVAKKKIMQDMVDVIEAFEQAMKSEKKQPSLDV